MDAVTNWGEEEGPVRTFLLYFANWYSPVSAGLMLPALSFRHFTQWYSCNRGTSSCVDCAFNNQAQSLTAYLFKTDTLSHMSDVQVPEHSSCHWHAARANLQTIPPRRVCKRPVLPHHGALCRLLPLLLQLLQRREPNCHTDRSSAAVLAARCIMAIILDATWNDITFMCANPPCRGNGLLARSARCLRPHTPVRGCDAR